MEEYGLRIGMRVRVRIRYCVVRCKIGWKFHPSLTDYVNHLSPEEEEAILTHLLLQIISSGQTSAVVVCLPAS